MIKGLDSFNECCVSDAVGADEYKGGAGLEDLDSSTCRTFQYYMSNMNFSFHSF